MRNRAGHSTPGAASQVLSSGLIASVSASNAPADAAQGSSLPLLQQRAAESHSACTPGPPGPFQPAGPSPHRSQSVLGSLVISSQVQNFALVSVKLHTVLAGPVLDLASFLLTAPKKAGKQILHRLCGWVKWERKVPRVLSICTFSCEARALWAVCAEVTRVEQFVLVLPSFSNSCTNTSLGEKTAKSAEVKINYTRWL